MYCIYNLQCNLYKCCLRKKNEPWVGVMKRSYRQNTEADYFPITACPHVFYSSVLHFITLLPKVILKKKNNNNLFIISVKQVRIITSTGLIVPSPASCFSLLKKSTACHVTRKNKTTQTVKILSRVRKWIDSFWPIRTQCSTVELCKYVSSISYIVCGCRTGTKRLEASLWLASMQKKKNKFSLVVKLKNDVFVFFF